MAHILVTVRGIGTNSQIDPFVVEAKEVGVLVFHVDRIALVGVGACAQLENRGDFSDNLFGGYLFAAVVNFQNTFLPP